MQRAGSVELCTITERCSIADEIWGPSLDSESEQVRLATLSSFFAYYREEQRFEQTPYASVIAAIRLLKQSPHEPKSELQYGDRASTISSETSEAPALDLAVRLMFLSACSRPGATTISGNIFRPKWKDPESLEVYLNRVFPVSQVPQQDLAAFGMGKLRVSYLQSYAGLQIKWTNHLSDHLITLRGEHWKSLYVFRHPGFLKVSLDALASSDEDMTQKPIDALKLGCLPPSLLKETLITLNIIFPLVGDSSSRAILEREVERNQLDRYFLDRFYLDSRDHERPTDALDPRDVRSLYEKYPYWADRLYDLWREADDPTPITRVERWTESRKNPRFTYWCAVVSIMAAVAFGMLATGLAAVQVWISWCSWVNDPSRTHCGYSGGTKSNK